MKKKVREILSKYRQNEGYTMEHAERDLLDLFRQSEQLPAFCEWLSERDFTCHMTSPEDWVDMYLKSK